jgi:hypothetical protein
VLYGRQHARAGRGHDDRINLGLAGHSPRLELQSRTQIDAAAVAAPSVATVPLLGAAEAGRVVGDRREASAAGASQQPAALADGLVIRSPSSGFQVQAPVAPHAVLARQSEWTPDAGSVLVNRFILPLPQPIMDEQAWAVCFFLKTQAKDRGYYYSLRMRLVTNHNLSTACANAEKVTPSSGGFTWSHHTDRIVK